MLKRLCANTKGINFAHVKTKGLQKGFTSIGVMPIIGKRIRITKLKKGLVL